MFCCHEALIELIIREKECIELSYLILGYFMPNNACDRIQQLLFGLNFNFKFEKVVFKSHKRVKKSLRVTAVANGGGEL